MSDVKEPSYRSGLDPFAAGKALFWAGVIETLVLILVTILADRVLDVEDLVFEFVLTVIGYAVVIFVLLRAGRSKGLSPTEVFRLNRVKTPNPLLLVLLGAGIISAELLVVNGLDFLLKGRLGEWTSLFPSAEPEGSMALSVVLLVCIVPIVEEVVFRGFLSKAFSDWGPGWAVFFPGIVFALLHHPIGMIGAFLVALASGILVMKYDSVIPGIFVHAGCNLVATILGFVETAASPTVFAVLFVSVSAGCVLLVALFRSRFSWLWQDFKSYWSQFKERPGFWEKFKSLAKDWAWLLIFAILLLRVGWIIVVTIRTGL